MKVEQKISQRFQAVVTEGEVALLTKHMDKYGLSTEYIPLPMVTGWRVKATSLLVNVMTKDSIYYTEFMNLVTGEGLKDDETFNKKEIFGQAVQILKAAWGEYAGGYFVSVQTRITADVFDDFLDRADYLLESGDFPAAAVIAGCVLEDGLRKICDREGVTFPPSPKPTISTFNQGLKNKGFYGKPVFHHVTSLGALRNHAAHGEWTEFAEDDVVKMVNDVRDFMAKYFV